MALTVKQNWLSSKSFPLFQLPEKGILEANNSDDPLPYYYKPFIGSVYCARIEQALSLLSPPYDSVLELGYGSGVLLPTLNGISEELSAIDLNSDPERINKNLAKIGIQVPLIQGDVQDAHYSPESFDLIVAISIFEHIENLAPVFERMYTLLKPSGHLLVGMPRVDSLMDKVFKTIGFDNINDHHVTSHRKCQEVGQEWFDLVGQSRLPQWLPQIGGLYFNMLFKKQDTNS